MTKDDEGRGRKLLAIPPPPYDAGATDRFGLPLRWTMLTDPPDRKKRLAALVADVFKTAVHHLGEADAKVLFNEVAKSKPGRKRGNQDPARDAEWLREYDARAVGLSGKELGTLRGKLAGEFRAKMAHPPASDDATYRHLLKLLRGREAEEKAKTDGARRMRALLRRVGSIL